MIADFAPRLIDWQRRQGRHDLPWQVSDPYAVWLSEIMLQQTQVETVIPYYRRFLARFPDLAQLAAADENAVLALWSGLGYYARARNLHRAARQIMAAPQGCFPETVEAIAALPGVGRSTAAAIAVFAFGQRAAILDGNVKRVFCRVFGIDGWPGERVVEQGLWVLAESLLPEREVAAYTQGLMDLGATLCWRVRPDCARCPFQADCVAVRDGRQAELPTARPRPALPERETTMLILLRAGEVLLQKRPATGVWGGLWSLPEVADEAALTDYLSRSGVKVEARRDLPERRRVFTHFRLRIRPVCLTVALPPARAEEPGSIWLPLADIEHAALPTPVRKLLIGLTNVEAESSDLRQSSAGFLY